MFLNATAVTQPPARPARPIQHAPRVAVAHPVVPIAQVVPHDVEMGKVSPQPSAPYATSERLPPYVPQQANGSQEYLLHPAVVTMAASPVDGATPRAYMVYR